MNKNHMGFSMEKSFGGPGMYFQPRANAPNLFERPPSMSKAMRNAAMRRVANAEREAAKLQELEDELAGMSLGNRKRKNRLTARRANSAKKHGPGHKSRARLAMEMNALAGKMGATRLEGGRKTRRRS